MNSSILNHEPSAVCATIAPEDLACGQFVAVLNETYEYPSFLWCHDGFGSREEPVRITWKSRNPGLPLEIKAICLPFVFLQDPFGKYRQEDVRSCEFVMLDTSYAETTKRCLAESKKQKKRNKR